MLLPILGRRELKAGHQTSFSQLLPRPDFRLSSALRFPLQNPGTLQIKQLRQGFGSIPFPFQSSSKDLWDADLGVRTLNLKESYL